MWGNTYGYKYAKGKIQRLKNPDGFTLSLDYDQKGRVYRVRDSKGCEERYLHEWSNKKEGPTVASGVVKICGRQLVYENRYIRRLNSKNKTVELNNPRLRRTTRWDKRGENIVQEIQGKKKKSFEYGTWGE